MKTRIEAMQCGPAGSRGLTLVELLVAVTISLLLIIVVAQLFLGSRATFATTDDVSRMQENIRFTQQLLIRTIHLAGYKSSPNSITGTVFDPATNPAIAAVDNGGLGGSDRLTIRYQGARGADGLADGSVVDCLGVKRDSGVTAINTFYIGTGANGRPALFCSNTGPDPALSPGVELVPDVQDMQIRFGEDTDNDLTTNHYVAGPAVMENVLSVRVALLFIAPSAGTKTVADPVKTYDLNGVTLGPFPDRRIRRAVTITINLRNRTP